MSVDPYRQLTSPYFGMGNNPLNLIDPDNGLFGKVRVNVYTFLFGGEYYQNADGDWIVTKNVGFDHYDGSPININYDGETILPDAGVNSAVKNFGYSGLFAPDGVYGIKEINFSPTVGGKIGPFSGRVGWELSYGVSNVQLIGEDKNIGFRFISTYAIDWKKFFSLTGWQGSGADVKASLGVKFSDKPTVVESNGSWKIQHFAKHGANILGNGGELKVSYDPSNGSTSYSFGVMGGVKAKSPLDRTVGSELKYSGGDFGLIIKEYETTIDRRRLVQKGSSFWVSYWS